jgi:hypothetical protein
MFHESDGGEGSWQWLAAGEFGGGKFKVKSLAKRECNLATFAGKANTVSVCFAPSFLCNSLLTRLEFRTSRVLPTSGLRADLI